MADQEDQAASASSPEDRALSESDIEKYESLFKSAKEKVESLKEWKEKMLGDNPPAEQFKEALGETLGYTSAVFNIFRDDRQFFRLADDLAAAIVDVRNYLGEEIMPLSKFHMFSRGMFEVCEQTLASGQYYEPIPFYGPPRKPGADPLEILKFYQWQYINKPKKDIAPGTPVDCVYYLEKGVPGIADQPYFVLGMSAPGMHATVRTFFGERPSFFTIEEAIVKRLIDKNQGNQPGYQVASFHGSKTN